MSIVRINDIVDAVSEYLSQPNIDLINRAYVYSAQVHQGQLRTSGEPYLNHPLWVAYLLTKLNGDEKTIAAGLLHDTIEDTWATSEDLDSMFGTTVSNLVDGVTKLGKLQFASKADRKAETVRKMFVAMANDLRVILIKLADRLHNMRTLHYLPEAKQRAIAQETLDLYSPLAGRLGIQWIRSELEDLCFRYLLPDEFEKIERASRHRKIADAQSIKIVLSELERILSAADIDAETSGRHKHAYSIYKKMQKRSVTPDQIYDLNAFRVIVSSLSDCYAVLGLVHNAWTPIPGRFKDYIAMPKANRYQSLHTSVIGPQGKPIEVQIRTRDMHMTAELGIAAHWSYKEEAPAGTIDQDSFGWLRQLYDWHTELPDSKQFIETVKIDLFQDEVYVFTPAGEVIELPANSTALDFAYKIHTEVGNKAQGAIIDGRLVPLHTALRNGSIVEVQTHSGQHPRRDWLGIVHTSSAKQKIRSYLNKEERAQALILGESLLTQALKGTSLRLSGSEWLTTPNGKRILRELRLKDREHLVEALGYGRLPLNRLAEAIRSSENPEKSTKLPFALDRIWRRADRVSSDQSALIIDGLTGIESHMAQCCKPLPGDDVVGYVRVGKGIKIHQKTCPKLKNANPDRILDVTWGTADRDGAQLVQISIECIDSPGILGKIGKTISQLKVNIAETSIRSTDGGNATGIVSVGVINREQLDRVIHDLRKLKGVTSVKRR